MQQKLKKKSIGGVSLGIFYDEEGDFIVFIPEFNDEDMAVRYICEMFKLSPVYAGVPLYQVLGYSSLEDFIEQTEDPFTEIGDFSGTPGLSREFPYVLMAQSFFVEMSAGALLEIEPEIGSWLNGDGVWLWVNPDPDILYTFTYTGILGTLTNTYKINSD